MGKRSAYAMAGVAAIALSAMTTPSQAGAGLDGLKAFACGVAQDGWAGAAQATGARYRAGSADAVAMQRDQEFPFIVKLKIINEETANTVTHSDCGGTIVNSRYILTAAHCIADDPVKRIEIITGDRNIAPENDGRILRTATDVVCHRGYRRDMLKDDVALIRLDEPLPPELAPARMAEATDAPPEEGAQVQAAGWQVYGQHVASKTMLRKARMTVREYRWPGHVVATSANGRADGVCRGESGGPLLAYRGSTPVLSGVLSGVEPPSVDQFSGASYDVCSKPGYEMYFTPVAKYRTRVAKYPTPVPKYP